MKHQTSLHLITASDLHFLSAKLHDKGDLIRTVSLKGDGKALAYSAEITEAFIDQVRQIHPDCLVLTGDLTYNGEKQSHLDLIALLDDVQSHGIPVAVIPGNHDIAIPAAAAFLGDAPTAADSVSFEEFKALYAPFGYGRARQKARDSFSYVEEVSDRVWLILIDVNTEHDAGQVSEATLTWLRDVLEAAAAQGKAVISATHQNILAHNERFTRGFLIKNQTQVCALLEEYHVRYNMSGHIHLQHLALNPEGLSESATGAVCLSPHHLAEVFVDDALHLSYQTRPVDVASWARRNGLDDPNLQDFSAFSGGFFHRVSTLQNGPDLERQSELTPEEARAMTRFAADITTAYFAGTLEARLKDREHDPGYQLWEQKGQHLRFWHNLNSFLLHPLKDENRASLSLAPCCRPAH